jgi:hypothetical protein
MKVHGHANMIKELIIVTKGYSWNESKLSDRVNVELSQGWHVSRLELDCYHVAKGLSCGCI